MRAPSVKIMFLATALLVGGCSTLGGEDKFSDAYVRSHIIAQKTTLAEVQALYGSPDSRTSRSDGRLTLNYHKRTASDDFTSVYNLAGNIPGAGALTSALASTGNATYSARQAGKSVDELTGTKHNESNSLWIEFDKNGVVTSWSL